MTLIFVMYFVWLSVSNSALPFSYTSSVQSGTNFSLVLMTPPPQMRNAYENWAQVLSWIILEGDVGEVISQNFPTHFQAQGEVVLIRIYRKNIPKDYHLSSNLQKTVKISPYFKFVGSSPTVKLMCSTGT